MPVSLQCVPIELCVSVCGVLFVETEDLGGEQSTPVETEPHLLVSHSIPFY